MTTKKPMSFLSIQCVLQYTEANLRFHLSQKCSSIRVVEKVVPLKINVLHLGASELRVNNTSYKFGIIRHFSDEKTPDHVLFENREGGIQHDVDRYGLKVNEPVEKENGEIIIDKREKDIKWKHQQLEEFLGQELMKLDHEYRSLDSYLAVGQAPPGGRYSLITIERKIKEQKDRLLPFRQQRNNLETQNMNYLEFTISNEKKGNQCEHLAYDKKMHEAMKYLLGKLLGKRRGAIEVKYVKISFNGLLRIPPAINLNVNELDTNADDPKLLDAIRPILDKKSFPLKLMRLEGSTPFKNFLIKNSQKLILNVYAGLINLPKLTHQRVHFVHSDFPGQEILWLIRHWIESKRAIGSCFSFKVEDVGEAKDIMKEIEQIPGARVDRSRRYQGHCDTIVISINDFSELKVTIKRRTLYRDIWNFYMKVEEK